MVHVTLFPMIKVLYFYIDTYWSICVMPVIPWCEDIMVYCSDIFWMILIWFQLPLLLRVPLVAFYKCYISVIKWSLYFTVLVVSFWIMFVSSINAMSLNRHGLFHHYFLFLAVFIVTQCNRVHFERRNSSSIIQGILHIAWNLKFHCHVNNIPPLFLILS